MFDPKFPYNDLPKLPTNINFRDVDIFEKLSDAKESLAKLNWIDKLNENNISFLLLKPLIIPEAVESSAIENINTTVSKVAQAENIKSKIWKDEKEVINYKDALLKGFDIIRENWLLLSNDIEHIQSILEPSKPGIQTSPDKIIATQNSDWKTKEVIYTPPQWQNLLYDLMSNLEKYINDDGMENVDPLIKSAIIHYQLETIHPFLDGNGRVGRMIIVLYLVLKNKLDFPVLFLSWYINKYKDQYYKLLNNVRTEWDWKSFILYMLEAINVQSQKTYEKIVDINNLKNQISEQIKNLSWVRYSEELLSAMFASPYIYIKNIQESTNISRQTLNKYFNVLEKEWIIKNIYWEKWTYIVYEIPWYRDILQRI